MSTEFFFIVCIIQIILVNTVHVICKIFSLLFNIYLLDFLNIHHEYNSKTTQYGAVFMRLVVNSSTGVLSCAWKLTINTLLLIGSFVYRFFPVLIFIVIFTAVNSHYEVAVKYIAAGYNILLQKNEFLSVVQRSTWLMKLFIEIIGPLWNFVVDTILGSFVQIINIIASGDHVRVSVYGIFTNISYFMQSLAVAVTEWVRINTDYCQYSNIVEKGDDIINGCLLHTNRELDLISPLQSVQNVVLSVSILVNGLCPAIVDVSSILVYPIYDINIVLIFHNIINFIIALVFTTWDITFLRCRLAVYSGKSTNLCTPDIKPLFGYIERIFIHLGKLIDNWLNWINVCINKTFMVRDTIDSSCVGEGSGLALEKTVDTFARNTTRIVAINPNLVAISDGYIVEYHKKIGSSQKKIDILSNFDPPVHVGYGLAPVEFSGSISNVDTYGDVDTGLLGCRCIDVYAENNMDKSNVSIICSVALFPGIKNRNETTTKVNTEIPIVFEQYTSSMLLKCKYLRISVEPIRFHKTVGTFDGINVKQNTQINCRTEPAMCNLVDAIIYVMPLCKRHNGEDNEMETTECITDSKYQTCYPYCVGLHQKRAGNTPITLYSERSLQNGRYMANMQCLNYESSTKILQDNEVANVHTMSTDYKNMARVNTQSEIITNANKLLCASSFIHSSYITETDSSLNLSDTSTISLVEKIFKGYGNTTKPPSSLLADMQPYIFAGDYIVKQHCGLTKTYECEWTSSLTRLNSDKHGQYKLVEIMSHIPTLSSDETIDLRSVHSSLFLPKQVMDVFGNINAAVQTEKGMFYAVNPDLASISERLMCNSQVSDSQQSSVQFIEKRAYRKPRVFFTKPVTECARGGPSVVKNGIPVTACSPDMIQEVNFTKNDSFWEYESFCNTAIEGTEVNMFVEDITYYDEKNVVVMVRRGPLTEYYFESGLNSQERNTEIERLSYTVYYFVNTDTLEVRKWTPYSLFPNNVEKQTDFGVLCVSDDVMPLLGSLFFSFPVLYTKLISTLLNDYVLNLLGLLDNFVSRGTRCDGSNLMHTSYDLCVAPIFSLHHIYYEYLAFDALTTVCLRRFASFILDRIGQTGILNNFAVAIIDVFTGSTVYSIFQFGAFIASAVIESFVAAVYTVFWVYNEIFIVTLKKIMHSTFRMNSELTFSRFVNHIASSVYESIQSGRMRDYALSPYEGLCISYGAATGDIQSPLGKFVVYSCLFSTNSISVAITTVSTVYTVGTITECICGLYENTRSIDISLIEKECKQKMPSTLWISYLTFLRQQSNDRGRIPKEICSDLVLNLKAVLYDIPSTATMYYQLMLEEIPNIPAYLLSLVNVPGFDDVSCSDFSRNEVVSIIPQPLSSFKRCAYTPNCRQKCHNEIDWFYSELMQVRNSNKPSVEGNLLAFLPVWKSQTLGLEVDFQVIAIQDYGELYQCSRWIVVIGRPLAAIDFERVWSMYFFCYIASDGTMFLRSSAQLPETILFTLKDDSYKDEKSILVSHITLVPTLPNIKGGVVITKWNSNTDQAENSIIEIYIDQRDVVHSKNIFSSELLIMDNKGIMCESLASNLDEECYAITQIQSFVIQRIFVLPGTESSSNNDYTILLSVRMNVVCANVALSEIEKTMEIVLHRVITQEYVVCNAYPKQRENSVMTYLKGGAILCPSGFHGLLKEVDGTQGKIYHLEILNITTTESHLKYSIIRTHTLKSDYFKNIIQNSNLLSSHANTPRLKHYTGVSLRTSTDDTILFTILTSNLESNTLTDNWIKEYTIFCTDQEKLEKIRVRPEEILDIVLTQNDLKVSANSALSSTLQVKVQMKCDYMSCQGCSTIRLQKLCYSAQRCATRRCVGTTINVQNPVCVFGSLCKEVLEMGEVGMQTKTKKYSFSGGNFESVKSLWVVFVDILITYYSMGFIDNNKQAIHIESISNYLISANCELKDVLAVASAIIPSIISQIIIMTSGRDNMNSLLDVTVGSTAIIQKNISPLRRLQTYTIILALTDMIYSISLIIYHAVQVQTKITLCIMSSMNTFFGGSVAFVSNNIGDPNNLEKFCKQDKTPDLTGNERDDEILLKLVKTTVVGTAGSDSVDIQYPRMTMNDYLLQAGDFLFVARKYPNIQLLMNANALFDWGVGLFSSYIQLNTVFESDTCKPYPTAQDMVMDCVCDDKKYSISTSRRKESLEEWSFWCTGILKMVNSDGYEVYVYNHISFDDLSNDLHDTGREYLKCISENNENQCTDQYRKIYSRKYQHFWGGNSKVSPLAVLNKCRENYAEKTWDVGIFALFNLDIQQNVISTGSISGSTIEMLKQRIKLHNQNNPAVACLESGPLNNNIKACMNLFFNYNVTIAGVEDYFSYGQNMLTAPDACGFLSSDVLLEHESVRRCHQHETHSQCSYESGISGTSCIMMLSTISEKYQSRRDSLNLYKIESIFDPQTAQNALTVKYENIKACALGFIDSFQQEITISPEIIDSIQLDIITGEGDFIHQLIDCIIMGAYNKTEIMPADSNGILENLLYSRHPTGESRDIPLPCTESVIIDTTNPDKEIFQRTCGTAARIAFIAYVIQVNILGNKNNNIKEQIKIKIFEKIQIIKEDMSDTSNFGCKYTDLESGAITGRWDKCCKIPGQCTPGESTFEPNLPDVSMFINSLDISKLLVENFISDVQILGLTSTEVFFVYVCHIVSMSCFRISVIALLSYLWMYKLFLCNIV